MNYRTTCYIICTAVFVLVPGRQAVAADNYGFQCKKGNAERVIRVLYPSGSEVPCEVHYVKEGGQEQVLWHYESTHGVCESKAQAFVEQQHSWGWDCKPSTGTPAPAVPEKAPNIKAPATTTTTDADVLDATANQGKEPHKQ